MDARSHRHLPSKLAGVVFFIPLSSYQILKRDFPVPLLSFGRHLTPDFPAPSLVRLKPLKSRQALAENV
jgi:hypothetical protein